MESLRGSNRAASLKMKRKEGEKVKQKEKTQGSRNEDIAKPAQKRKASSPSSQAKKVKGRENWKPLSTSTIVAVENIMDIALLATLALNQKKRKECKEHLSVIKNRFLSECAELKAPVQKQKSKDCSSYRKQEETKMSVTGNKTLSTLEEDLKSVVSALEKGEEQMISLQQSCSSLREQIEDEEDKLKESLQISKQAVLNLPPYSLPEDETTPGVNTLIRTIPEREREATAQRLGDILQKSKTIRNVQLLLLHAHKHNDQL
ncbi:centromere protein Q isoform X3 [Cynoglossus semilaevis]|uniref:centromere protein Q isoform X3 n=1 Tax=Cynoglossus semilaevis TaxID=244447 RepID=UPI0007DC99B0|nr:centromere protein Q-like isoform X3 [Cynoglossus semilaevis]